MDLPADHRGSLVVEVVEDRVTRGEQPRES
jgi:hypothetical protein